MFAYNFKGIKIGISFSFFLVISLLLINNNDINIKILTSLVCCFLHEIGHLFFMFLYSQKPESIVIYGGGIKITPDNNRLISIGRELAVLLAGCTVNLTLALITVMFRGLNFFAEVNLLLGIFNLMPFKYFDGGRALELITNGSRICDIIKCLFILLALFIVFVMSVYNNMNISFLVTFLFILISEMI